MNTISSIQSMLSTSSATSNTFTDLATISGLKLWLDAQKYSSLTFSSPNIISQWNDLANNTNVFSYGGYQPSYSATGMNGKPTIRFNTSGLISTTTNLYNNFSNFFYFAVINNTSSSTNSISSPFAITNSTGINSGGSTLAIYATSISPLPGFHTAGNAWTYNNNGQASGFVYNNVITPDNSNIIFALSVINNIQTFYINGVAGISKNVYFNGNNSSCVLIGSSGYGGDWYVGNISEVAVYTSNLTTLNRQQIEGYLAWKWGINGSLPTNHPYYNNSP